MAGKDRVLVVDDKLDNIEVLRGILEFHGFEVSSAISGESALLSLETITPSLILLDIRMPGLGGYETCKRLKANARTCEIPVIFISALSDIADKLKAFEVGGVDYVTKPFEEMEVISRTRTHIQLYKIKHNLEQLVEERTRDLSLSEARYRVLFEDSPLAAVIYDADSGCILKVNRSYNRLLGYPEKEVFGKAVYFTCDARGRDDLKVLIQNLTIHSDETVFTGILNMHHADGKVLEIEGVIHRIDYPGHRAQILMLQDITAKRQSEERLQQLAKGHQAQLEKLMEFDALTGLPTRKLLTHHMREGIHQAKSIRGFMAVLYVDMDSFGQANEDYGSHIADNLLISAANCMRSCLRGGDTLARIGSDEFVLLVLLNKVDELNSFIERLQSNLATPFIDDNFTITLSVSIGFTVYPQDGADPDTLLRHADQAMMAAKRFGKGQVQRYDPEADKVIQAQHKTVELMRAALKRREFVLYYQPKVDMRQGVVVGAEALIRWQHPERGMLPPGVFLPAIEEDVFMIELSDWVIAEALRQMTRWRAIGLQLVVSVNISAMHLMRPDFVDSLIKHLAAYPDTPRGSLEIEVLETSTLNDLAKVKQVIIECQNLGIGFSLDDFGTGYSSLTYLRQLPADTLKIDQTFVRDMLKGSEDSAIVSGVIGLAAAFKRNVIAEGVETLEHGKLLLQMGCDMAQGYGISRPMPAEDMPKWLECWPDEAWKAIGDTVVA